MRPLPRLVAASNSLLVDRRGATMVEYALLLFLILVFAAAVFHRVGGKVAESGRKTEQAFGGGAGGAPAGGGLPGPE